MSYFTEKLKVEEKIKKLKIILAIILSVLLLGLIIFSAFVPPFTWKYHVSKPKIGKRLDGELRLHFLDVGQGDATLIELPDGKIMLIDGGDGEASTAKHIMRYLNALKIKTIDYLLLTHADSDHCGALDVVLECKEVQNVFLPNTKETVNTEYAQFSAALLKEECNVTFSSRKIVLDGAGGYPYTLSFLYPYSLDVEEGHEQQEENNDSSAVVWLDYQGVSTLFMGDAPMEIEEILIRDDHLGLFESRGVDLSSTEILKVAHHGSQYSTGVEFLQHLNIKTAVISCGEGNLYGHPTVEVLERLQAVNANIYRTDKDKDVVITISTDGKYTTDFIA